MRLMYSAAKSIAKIVLFSSLIASSAWAQTFSIEKDFIEYFVSSLRGSGPAFAIPRALSEKVTQVNTPTHTEIVPEYHADGLKFILRYDSVALNQPSLLLKDVVLLNVLLASSGHSAKLLKPFELSENLRSQIRAGGSLAELIANARMGSPTAKARWAWIQAKIFDEVKIENTELLRKAQVDPETLQNIRAELKANLPQLEAAASAHAVTQQKQYDRWKQGSGVFEKLETETKLQEMILNNDRKGVAQLIESYLPWPLMEPVETIAWRTWLTAIENPDWKNTTVAFRGVRYEGHKLQDSSDSKTPGKKYGFISTALMSEQENFTRRLRILSENRESNGDRNYEARDQVVPSVRIIDMMMSHAWQPNASNFISFTFSAKVAASYGGDTSINHTGGLLAVKMDSRRLLPNIFSGTAGEIELLAPLIIFPDEVIKYQEGLLAGDTKHDEKLKQFVHDVELKAGLTVGPMIEGQTARELNKQFSQRAYSLLNEMLTEKNPANGLRCYRSHL